MRRLILPLALILALATGAVLAETRTILRPIPAVALPADPTANADLVRRWYDTVNQALAFGDSAALDVLLAPDFVSHAGWSDGEASREDLVAYLADLRTTHPATRLTILDVTGVGDRVVARVQVSGALHGRFLGLPLAGVRVWSSVDVFRIAGGRIAELWDDGAPLADLEPLLTVPLPGPLPAGDAVLLERRTYPPGQGELLDARSGFAIILVERGQLQFTADRLFPNSAWRVTPRPADHTSALRPMPSDSPAELAPGTAHLVWDGVGQVRNDGDQPAVALVVSGVSADSVPNEFGKVSPATVYTANGAARAATPVPAVASAPLAGGQAVEIPGAYPVVTIGRAILPTGGISPHTVDGVELIAVESGDLVLATEGVAAWVHRGQNRTAALLATALLAPGDGALLYRHTQARYLNATDRPVQLLLVTIWPAAQGAP